ncbi:histone-lysine N-methyltransferase ASHH2-like [Brassica napus]|uniref:histone-lysine N-methyltransferase ASHH2-like n=1 Tax=Brassica napus TaxID=3708 RepID=UPI0020787465|nr:histone-lysine N-methyltransferase ASHH2-like [Brassica napus]
MCYTIQTLNLYALSRFTDKAYKKISLLLDPSCLDLCLIHVGEVTVVGAKGNLGRFINNCRLTEKDQESIYDYNYVRVFAAAAAKKCYCGSSHCRG